MRARFAKLAGFYFFYFSILGVYIPYWPLYLKDLGFSPSAIGELIAITLGTKIIAPYLWGWLGDHSHNRMKLIYLAGILSPLCFYPIFFSNSYLNIALTSFLFSFFWNALLPQVEVITLDSLKHQVHHYSRIRLWGSVGFIVLAIVCAPLITYFGSHIVPWIVAAMLSAMAVMCLTLASQRFKQNPPAAHLFSSLTWPIVALLTIGFLVQLSHGAYYAYFTIFMEDYGHSRTLVGYFWGVGVLCEILILFYVSYLLKKVRPTTLLIVVLLTTSLRWLLIGHLPHSFTIIIFAQALHAITFGVYHAVMMHTLTSKLPTGLKGRGQALYSAISFGVGGSLGTYLSSILWEDFGGSFVFTLSAGASAIGVFLVLSLRNVKFQQSGSIQSAR